MTHALRDDGARRFRPLLLCTFFGIGPLHYQDPYCLYLAMLSERLREEEMRYTATLKAREGLIRKHGPTREDIHS